MSNQPTHEYNTRSSPLAPQDTDPADSAAPLLADDTSDIMGDDEAIDSSSHEQTSPIVTVDTKEQLILVIQTTLLTGKTYLKNIVSTLIPNPGLSKNV